MVAMHADVIELTEYHPWRRLVFFLAGFAVCAAAALGYVYSRPAQYIAVAQLRIVPSVGPIDAKPGNAPSPRDSRMAFLTEVQVLSSRAVLEQAVMRLKNTATLPDLGPDPAGAVQHLLRARPIGQTQIVELSAEGRDPRFLTRLLDTVADSWRDRAMQLYQQQIADENQDLIHRAGDLHQQTMAARAKLDQFRDEHGILPTDDVGALAADLQKLRAPYSAAQASLTEARAQMRTLQNASDAAASAEQSNPGIAELEQKAAALRDQLHDLERRFSLRELRSDTDAQNLLERLGALDREITARRSEELRSAGAQLQARQSRFERLSSDISVMKKIVADFAADRPQYVALQDDLDRAEKLERAILDRVAQSQADQRARAPRLDMLQAAQVAASRASPNYALNASIALFASLGMGVLAALFCRVLDRAPAIAWTATGRRYRDSAQARISYRADALSHGVQSGRIKLLPAPDPESFQSTSSPL